MKKRLRDYLKSYQEQYPATARLDHYVKEAQARLEGDADRQEADSVRRLLGHANAAREALSAADVDRFAQAFERVIRLTVTLHLPEIDKAAQRERGRKSKGRKGKREALATILEQVCDEIGSTDPQKVLAYWREDDGEDNSCWFRHGLSWNPAGDKYGYESKLGKGKATEGAIRTALSRYRKRINTPA